MLWTGVPLQLLKWTDLRLTAGSPGRLGQQRSELHLKPEQARTEGAKGRGRQRILLFLYGLVMGCEDNNLPALWPMLTDVGDETTTFLVGVAENALTRNLRGGVKLKGGSCKWLGRGSAMLMVRIVRPRLSFLLHGRGK